MAVLPDRPRVQVLWYGETPENDELCGEFGLELERHDITLIPSMVDLGMVCVKIRGEELEPFLELLRTDDALRTRYASLLDPDLVAELQRNDVPKEQGNGDDQEELPSSG